MKKKVTDKTRQKMRDARLGYRWSDDMKKMLSEAHQGQVPWMKGKKHTAEAKAKVSKNKTGKKLPPFTLEHKKKISLALQGRSLPRRKGKDHHNWKGGVTSELKLLRIKFQQTIQQLVLERDDYTCQLCGMRGGSLHVDHIQSFADYVAGRFDADNCRTLCRECHYFVTFNKVMPKGCKWSNRHNRIKYTVD